MQRNNLQICEKNSYTRANAYLHLKLANVRL